jgi:uncharacterized membrane protein
MNRYGWGIGAGSIFLGLGLGRFFDGIVLHQILQWHHMLSAIEPVDTVRGLEINTLGDGLFHGILVSCSGEQSWRWQVQC